MLNKNLSRVQLLPKEFAQKYLKTISTPGSSLFLQVTTRNSYENKGYWWWLVTGFFLGGFCLFVCCLVFLVFFFLAGGGGRGFLDCFGGFFFALGRSMESMPASSEDCHRTCKRQAQLCRGREKAAAGQSSPYMSSPPSRSSKHDCPGFSSLSYCYFSQLKKNPTGTTAPYLFKFCLQNWKALKWLWAQSWLQDSPSCALNGPYVSQPAGQCKYSQFKYRLNKC